MQVVADICCIKCESPRIGIWPTCEASVIYQPAIVLVRYGNGTDGVCHHYALIRQGETIRFHQDGHLSSSDTDAHNTVGLAPDSQSITLGMKASGGVHSPGNMDDFRIYDRALSAEEVAAMV